MWLPKTIVDEVRAVARIHYVDRDACVRWNATRHEGELRLLTGWTWTSIDGREYQQGLKTRTCCLRDAYYALIVRTAAPSVTRLRLRVVK